MESLVAVGQRRSVKEARRSLLVREVVGGWEEKEASSICSEKFAEERAQTTGRPQTIEALPALITGGAGHGVGVVDGRARRTGSAAADLRFTLIIRLIVASGATLLSLSGGAFLSRNAFGDGLVPGGCH